MAKQYLRIGQVLKGTKDADGGSKPDYIKLTNHRPTLESLVKALSDYLTGDLSRSFYLNLESQVAQLASVDRAVQEGRMQPSNAEKARERIGKMPDFVRFEITTSVER